ncbi:NAD(P)/FAD-dependent oxidoreductase [Aldersonia sp. NBC_00410]|uniref:flavin-containing monooxygenase n=1 Tax=Aldersonia sp. NBC_00410 TaxID=2975954 RepID=UPI00224D75F6|nr:NAD(P)/FAD-dependent oxidoreductase [Aldersonia sp. NBC_00410]MCX5042364.1 NAD(P)/FAD-dependent oxidoreductase [Aldersonia sp. NBC_00410]MCX5042387.1 NAD(P)/FAD-dependent oxidoreductase [Aldersonia sp. NBC_00410]
MTAGQTSTSTADYDAIVIGAGFAGLYALHKLRDQMGLRVRVFEAGDDLGGTWYWNRYPGARCDIESIHYSYSFSAELEQEWEWSEKYASQPEILAYLNHVADRFNLRDDIEFATRITSAVWNDDRGLWQVGSGDGSVSTGRYLISGAGNLSVPKNPEFDGIDTFVGEVYLTGKWPHEGVDFTGKRVAVIGTGSSGIQAITEIGKQAGHLTVFQRTPNYATPLGNAPSDPVRVGQVKANYPAVRDVARSSFIGVPYDQAHPSALGVSPETRRRIFDECWDEGGFRFFIDTFQDVLFDKAANDTVSNYVRERIRERVSDPVVAEKLSPTNHPYGTKRPPFETNYYETYNRDNVRLIDVASSPITAVTENGVRTAEGDYDFDVIVLATGFDAMTGPLLDMGIVGRDGRKLSDKWVDGPHTYLGLTIHGFPNLFLITGPQSPSVLYNMPLAIEDHVDFVADAIDHLRRNGLDTMEPTLDAETKWVDHANELAQATLLPGTDSWWMGANIPGKPRVCLVYLGGAPAYREICADVVDKGYEGFTLSCEGVARQLTPTQA